MAENASLKILKEAFDAGFNAFNTVEKNDKGHYQNPNNPYQRDSLPWKEWIRGFNRGYWEQQRANKVTANGLS